MDTTQDIIKILENPETIRLLNEGWIGTITFGVICFLFAFIVYKILVRVLKCNRHSVYK